MDNLTLTPTRPYMVRAIFAWLEDNALTPYIMVNATYPNVQVPTEYVQEGKIVLNIASQATGNLQISNDFIHFYARFGGVSREIWLPMPALMGIYAKEDNTVGTFFDPDEYANYTPAADNAPNTSPTGRPKRANTAGLKIIE